MKTEQEWEEMGRGIANMTRVTEGRVETGDLLICGDGSRTWAKAAVGIPLDEIISTVKVYRFVNTDTKPESSIPTAASDRKTYPIATGVLGYFPDAIAAIAHVSFVGNEQHNPGTPLHWDRTKSTDEADALMRHFMERGKMDTDGLRHSAKMAWRALALLQKELEANNKQVSD